MISERPNENALAKIQSVRPNLPVLRTSAKTGEGLDEGLRFLEARAAAAPRA